METTSPPSSLAQVEMEIPPSPLLAASESGQVEDLSSTERHSFNIEDTFHTYKDLQVKVKLYEASSIESQRLKDSGSY